MLRFSSSSLVKCILAACSGLPPQCSTFSSVRYSTGLWDCPWCWCCVYGMQVRHLFLLTRESGTTIGSRNNCYTPGEWKDQESLRLRRAGLDAIGLFFSPVMLFPPPLYSTTIAANLLLVDEIMKAGMSSLKGWGRVHLGTYLADNVFMLSCWHASDRVALLFVKCTVSCVLTMGVQSGEYHILINWNILWSSETKPNCPTDLVCKGVFSFLQGMLSYSLVPRTIWAWGWSIIHTVMLNRN